MKKKNTLKIENKKRFAQQVEKRFYTWQVKCSCHLFFNEKTKTSLWENNLVNTTKFC